MYKGFIFDLDGTLLDSTHVWKDVDVISLSKRGLPVPQDYCEKICTMGLREAAVYTIERFGLKEQPETLMDEWEEIARNQYATNVGLFPYAKEYLQQLKDEGCPLAVATTGHRNIYTPALISNDIKKYFDFIADAEMVSVGKSEPYIYLLAAEKIGLNPSEIMVFEDVLPAVVTAKKAGFNVTAVLSEENKPYHHKLKETADYTITDYKRLLK